MCVYVSEFDVYMEYMPYSTLTITCESQLSAFVIVNPESAISLQTWKQIT